MNADFRSALREQVMGFNIDDEMETLGEEEAEAVVESVKRKKTEQPQKRRLFEFTDVEDPNANISVEALCGVDSMTPKTEKPFWKTKSDVNVNEDVQRKKRKKPVSSKIEGTVVL